MSGEKIKIPLTQGKHALIDESDREIVEKRTWFAVKHINNFYASTNIKKGGRLTTIYMHRFITGDIEGMQVDHLNRDGLDNRRGNLRICTSSQNNANRKPLKGKTSKYKGVHWDKRMKKWRARMNPKPKIIHLGYFGREIEAARAYDKKALELYGEFAYLNFGGAK
ncbi:HNH endonuclease [Candidatus Pacearchaeota archaeon]|nr:HNH endonuclease [Candidatus Pacearchaeota archaeon]